MVFGEDKSYVRRTIADEKCAETAHPYMRLMSSGAGGCSTQIGYKQLSPYYDNLFVEHYLEELKYDKDGKPISDSESWVR